MVKEYMIEFKNVEIADKEWAKPLLTAADYGGCHQNFTNIFAWADFYNYQIARVRDFLVVKGFYEGVDYYFYPAGRGDVRPVLEEMRHDARERGYRFVMLGLSSENYRELEQLYPGQFEFRKMHEGSFDYVYRIEKLVHLKGNKLHSKRNHINYFKKTFSNWRFELITEDNLEECWQMNLKWCEQHSSENAVIASECCAVKRCFENFEALGLEGALIRLDGQVIAYTMGEQLNSKTYVIHVEKAFSEIRGAYQMINREFAAYVHQKYPHLIYMNREEDMGFEGLRKAKMSYYPDAMEEKYSATYRE